MLSGMVECCCFLCNKAARVVESCGANALVVVTIDKATNRARTDRTAVFIMVYLVVGVVGFVGLRVVAWCFLLRGLLGRCQDRLVGVAVAFSIADAVTIGQSIEADITPQSSQNDR